MATIISPGRSKNTQAGTGESSHNQLPLTTYPAPTTPSRYANVPSPDPLTLRFAALPVKTQASSIGGHIAAMLAHRNTRRADAYEAESGLSHARTDSEWDRLSEAAMWAGEAWRQAEGEIVAELDRLEAAITAAAK